MIELHLGFHARIHRIAFDDLASGQAALDKLVPLLGRDKWGANCKGEEPTHVIKSPIGDVVVVLEKVETATLVDTEKEQSMYLAEANRNEDFQMDRLIRQRQRLKDAGVDSIR